MGGSHSPREGCTNLSCPSYFPPRPQTFLCSGFHISRRTPKYEPMSFTDPEHFCGGFVHILHEFAFQHGRGAGKGKASVGNHKATSLSITMGLAKTVKTRLFIPPSKLAQYVNNNSLGENIGHGRRDLDSSFTSFTTCVTCGKPGNNSGPLFPHL